MNRILKVYRKTLKNRNYAETTINNYSFYLEKFLAQTDTYPNQITTSEIKGYLLSQEYSSVSQQNQIINSIKIFAKVILKKKDLHLKNIERPKKEKKLPRVIDKKHLLKTISEIENSKHKLLIALPFSVGLRVSEVINLKIEDIDSKRMIIHIRNAKGRKDRIVPLTDTILDMMRKYFLKHRPKVYLFNGQTKLQYTQSSCNKVVKKYLGDSFHYHLIRHSAATSILENGTDIAIISKLLGHSNVKTTMIYTHVSTNTLKKIAAPI